LQHLLNQVEVLQIINSFPNPNTNLFELIAHPKPRTKELTIDIGSSCISYFNESSKRHRSSNDGSKSLSELGAAFRTSVELALACPWLSLFSFIPYEEQEMAHTHLHRDRGARCYQNTYQGERGSGVDRLNLR
jgi:hypothetical protein